MSTQTNKTHTHTSLRVGAALVALFLFPLMFLHPLIASADDLYTNAADALFGHVIPWYDEMKYLYGIAESTSPTRQGWEGNINAVAEGYHMYSGGHGGGVHSRGDIIDYYTDGKDSTNGVYGYMDNGSSFVIPPTYDFCGKTILEYTSGADSEMFTCDVHIVNVQTYQVSGQSYVINDFNTVTFRRYRLSDMYLEQEVTFFPAFNRYSYTPTCYRSGAFKPLEVSMFLNCSLFPGKDWEFNFGMYVYFQEVSVNSCVVDSISTPPSNEWYRQNLFYFYLSAGQTNDLNYYNNYYNYHNRYTDVSLGDVVINYWGDEFKAGDTINSTTVNNYSYFTYDNNKLSFDPDAYLTAVLPDLQVDFLNMITDVMTHMPSVGEPWGVEPLYNLPDMFPIYIEIPTGDGFGGIPDAWLRDYPDYTTAWEFDLDEPEPVEGDPPSIVWWVQQVGGFLADTQLLPLVLGVFSVSFALWIFMDRGG